ncbi:shikimate kinase [Winogradskyella ouciana]|uniref:Shikimate kinase n=1 Tax=Winogradskyella ouciana TaxID=2608631 RepID=A0A7K1GF98_9FLAO|nr:shikimate kinase [Winogradskyella ouciana]MTE27803.1 shikimate kinase [Winogradskyella ouciana]
MIVVLMGYMGSGKSTIGKELATLLKYNFLDLDDYISEKENATISDIFKDKGEIYFRKKETEYLKEIIDSYNDIVLALGGGTPCYGNNLKILNDDKKVVTIYLKLSIPLLATRLYAERDNRPLISHLSSEEELLEFIGKHIFERTQYYNQAQHIITTDHQTKKDILEAILLELI